MLRKLLDNCRSGVANAKKRSRFTSVFQPKLGFVPIGTGGGACRFAGFFGAGGGGGFRAIEAVNSVGAGD